MPDKLQSQKKIDFSNAERPNYTLNWVKPRLDKLNQKINQG